jgi:hypothetical protein
MPLKPVPGLARTSLVAVPFGLGVTLMQFSVFPPAYGAAVWWLSSDFLATRKKQRRAVRRDTVRSRQATHSYQKYLWAGLGAIATGTTFVLMFTYAQHQAYELSRNAGLLVPADDQSPEVCGDLPLPNGVLALYLGTNRLHAPKTGSFSPLVYEGDRMPLLTLHTDHTGYITLSIDIRSRDGRIVARVDKNRFVVNENNILRMRRPDRSTLIVDDQEGADGRLSEATVNNVA